MAGSKNKKAKTKEIPTGKTILQGGSPDGKHIKQGGNPESYYGENPAWAFAHTDEMKWAFTAEHIGNIFWDEILPRLQKWETQKWSEIFVEARKHNHSNDVELMNKVARDRLEELHIEAEALQSLSLQGKHRLYGYMQGRVFNILWFDDDHGDNDTCVYRSRKKYT